MTEFEAYLLGIGRCAACGEPATQDQNVMFSDDDDNAVLWHTACAPAPRIVRVQMQCRAKAAWN